MRRAFAFLAPLAFVNPLAGTAGKGATFPGASVPFGMVQPSPDTDGPAYRYESGAIRDFSLVHVSGAGVPMGGEVRLMPGPGPSSFSHANERAEPGYYRVALDSGVTVELTAGLRSAMERYTFGAGTSPTLTVGGRVRRTGRAELTGSDRRVHFVARFGSPIRSFLHGRATFSSSVVTARIGISWVDARGARRNLEGGSFETMRARAGAAWNRELGRVRTGAGGDQGTFYTALYHALLEPSVFSDADGRYRGLDHRVHRARGRVQYTDLSLWDSERASNQLLALLEPRRYRDVVLSLLADHRERGKLPRWVEKDTDPAYMEGDPALPAIAEGVCRGLVRRADASALYSAGLKLRRRRGHPPRASARLGYGVDDFALALVADGLGKHREARKLAAASLAYRSPLGGGFLEGTPFQYSWLAPHDARGLFDRMGGDAAAVQRLDAFFASPVAGDDPSAPPGHRYDAPGYAVGNEQDLQVPWMYAFARASSHGAPTLARLRGWFGSGPGGLPGNDDLGALSAWYVFAALGFGPVTPGAPFYVPSGPAFDSAVVSPAGGHAFTVSPAASGRSWIPASALRRGGTIAAGPAPDGTAPPPSLSDSPLSRFGCVPARR